MTGYIAESIRPWLCQHGVEIMDVSGEGSRDSIRASVQTDVRVANFTEDMNGSAVGPTIPPSFLDDLIPEDTEIMPQFRKGITYVKLAE